MADWVGAAVAALMSLLEAIQDHVFAPEHPRRRPCRWWPKARPEPAYYGAYVRDDRLFAGPAPAAAFRYSRDRGGEHPERHLAGYARPMQADADAGFNRLYETDRQPGPIVRYAKRKFFELAQL